MPPPDRRPVTDATPDPRCGSYAGVMAHRHAGERCCQRCRVARAAYMRAWRAAAQDRGGRR